MAVENAANRITTRDVLTREVFMGPVFLLASPLLFQKLFRQDWLRNMEATAKRQGLGPTLAERAIMRFIPREERIGVQKRVTFELMQHKIAGRVI